jgi:hypothetical protein
VAQGAVAGAVVTHAAVAGAVVAAGFVAEEARLKRRLQGGNIVTQPLSLVLLSLMAPSLVLMWLIPPPLVLPLLMPLSLKR